MEVPINDFDDIRPLNNDEVKRRDRIADSQRRF